MGGSEAAILKMPPVADVFGDKPSVFLAGAIGFQEEMAYFVSLSQSEVRIWSHPHYAPPRGGDRHAEPAVPPLLLSDEFDVRCFAQGEIERTAEV